MSRTTRSKFMMIVAIIFGVYALLWGAAPYEAINFPAHFILDSLDWPIDRLAAPLNQNEKLYSAIGGGLLGALSIFLGGIAVPAIREGNKEVIRTTVFAMTTWYVIDSMGSIVSGVASNAVFNSVYLILILTPLLWKDVEGDLAG